MIWKGTWAPITDDELWGERYDAASNLGEMPCHSWSGSISDCFACYWFPFYLETFRMTLELAWFGRTNVMVSSCSSRCGLHSLESDDLSCNWWKEEKK